MYEQIDYTGREVAGLVEPKSMEDWRDDSDREKRVIGFSLDDKLQELRSKRSVEIPIRVELAEGEYRMAKPRSRSSDYSSGCQTETLDGRSVGRRAWMECQSDALEPVSIETCHDNFESKVEEDSSSSISDSGSERHLSSRESSCSEDELKRWKENLSHRRSVSLVMEGGSRKESGLNPLSRLYANVIPHSGAISSESLEEEIKGEDRTERQAMELARRPRGRMERKAMRIRAQRQQQQSSRGKGDSLEVLEAAEAYEGKAAAGKLEDEEAEGSSGGFNGGFKGGSNGAFRGGFRGGSKGGSKGDSKGDSNESRSSSPSFERAPQGVGPGQRRAAQASRYRVAAPRDESLVNGASSVGAKVSSIADISDFSSAQSSLESRKSNSVGGSGEWSGARRPSEPYASGTHESGRLATLDRAGRGD